MAKRDRPCALEATGSTVVIGRDVAPPGALKPPTNGNSRDSELDPKMGEGSPGKPRRSVASGTVPFVYNYLVSSAGEICGG